MSQAHEPDPDLFELAERQQLPARGHSHNLAAEARAWMDQNPQAMELYERFFRELGARGKPFGISLITERIRWEYRIQWSQDFKLNNNFRAYVARHLCSKHPEYAHLVEMRTVHYHTTKEAG